MEFDMDRLSARVAARFKARKAMEHPSEKAMRRYLHEHPNADPKDHHVKQEGQDEKKHREEAADKANHMVKQLHSKGEIEVRNPRTGEKFTIKKQVSKKWPGIHGYAVVQNGKEKQKAEMMKEDDLWRWMHQLEPA